MHTIVVGVGYTGQRVLDALPDGEAHGLPRSRLDLDDVGDTKLEFPASYSLLYTVPPRKDGDADSRLETMLDLIDPAPRRFVYLSTSGVYGDRGGRTVDETSPPEPLSGRAKRRLAAESALASWCDSHGVTMVVLRVPGIYGPGRLGLERIASGIPVIRETEANPGNRIHVDDLVACCLRALDESVPSGTYNVGDGDHRSSTWFAKAVAAAAGLAPPPEISLAEATESFSEARLSFLRESRLVDTTRMREALGVTLAYDNPEDGIRASL